MKILSSKMVSLLSISIMVLLKALASMNEAPALVRENVLMRLGMQKPTDSTHLKELTMCASHWASIKLWFQNKQTLLTFGL